MQLQINAIKQLLETNNAIAESIDQCIVKWAGESASWEQAATFKTAEEFAHEDNRDSLDPVFKVLWRSRIDLNDARINAEEVDLEKFLTILKGSIAEYRIKDDLDTKTQLKERDRQIENLKHQLEVFNGEITRLQLQNYSVVERDRQIKQLEEQNEAIAKQLVVAERRISDLFDKNGIDKAVNDVLSNELDEIERLSIAIEIIPTLLEKIAERDREIELFKTRLELAVDREVMARKAADEDRQIQELEITIKNHREQFDNLKSHFEVTLRAIAMNLNALKGDRKPDREEEVDGVKVRYRDYSDNLSHKQKTLIIEHQQRAIAEEAKKLKGIDLKDFSFDEIPF